MIHEQQILEGLKTIILETGQWIREERSKFDRNTIEKKGRNDLVSYVDRQAELMLSEALSKLLPGSGFINEEGGTHLSDQYNWIIDPLDGTTNYIHDIPVYGVSVALVSGNDLILGCVYDPEHNELFSAIRGQGAYLNGNLIRVSSTAELQDSLIATGFPYTVFEHLDSFIFSLKEILGKCRGIRRPGAASIDLVWTACGRFDGFYESHLNPWDVAAGALIVQEAGGTVSTYSGTSDFIFGKEILATNGFIHSEISQILKRYPVQ